MTPDGLLHSDICGSMPAYGSPQHFAVCCVLLRLSVPRHSPCALCSLTMFVLWFFLKLFKIAVSFSYLYFYCLSFTLLVLFGFQSAIPSFRLLVGLSGLEPPTSRLSGVRSNRLSYKPIFPAVKSYQPSFSLSGGGDKRDRTVDPLLAKQVLSQLSYTPIYSSS